MLIRVGVEGGRRSLLNRIAALGAPILVSANSLWKQDKQRFIGWQTYRGFDTALDSGGFIAMKKYGGFRWSVEQYVTLAKSMRPTWWAQMDFCCEPELAADRAAVWKRIDSTAEHLQACQQSATAQGVPAPMPVLQGWSPADYCQGPIYAPGYPWPGLVGIGSVCRRPIAGPTGILAVVDALHRAVPAHVKFHLFGVKSQALTILLERYAERIAGMDSMAWNLAARWDCHRARVPCKSAHRIAAMEKWYLRQTERAQPSNQFLLNL